MLWWLLLFILLIGDVPYYLGQLIPLFFKLFSVFFFFPTFFFLTRKKKKMLINRRERAITLILTSGGKTAVNNVVFTFPDSVHTHVNTVLKNLLKFDIYTEKYT